MSAQPVSLAALDSVIPYSLAEDAFAANVAALRETSHEFADTIAGIVLPDHWRAATTLDGRGAWRIESAGEAPRWLGESAAPLRRASATLRTFTQTDRNVVLPVVAAGAELDLLLERLAPYQAVFVFEENAQPVAALLRLRDYATAIRNLRVIFVPPQSEESFLTALLRREEGLLPPVSLIVLPGVDDARIASVRGVCERVVNSLTQERTRALSECHATLATPKNRAIRPIVIALTPEPVLQELGRFVGEASQTVEAAPPWYGMDEPRRAGSLPALRAVSESKANVIFGLGAAISGLPMPPEFRQLRWIPALADIPENWGTAACLAGTPSVAAEMGRRFPQVTVHDFPLGAPDTEIAPSAERASEAYVIGDLLDPRPAFCGIEQPTHVMIWEQAGKVIESGWESRQILHVEGLLLTAERAAGVTLEDSSMRPRMLGLLERVLIPAVVMERIHRTLVDGGIAVRTVGRGWGRVGIAALTGTLTCAALAKLATPAAAIFIGCPDPLTPALLSAGTLQWPLHLYSPGGVSREPLLGGVLRAGEHYAPFDSGRALLAGVGADRKDTARAVRRAERTRSHLATKETYAARWRKLLEVLPS